MKGSFWFLLAAAIFTIGLLTLVVTVRFYVISDAEYIYLKSINALPASAVTQLMLNSSMFSGLAFSVVGCCLLFSLAWFKRYIP